MSKAVLVLVNPHSGPGKAEMHLRRRVLPTLQKASGHYNVVVTEHPNHALNLIKSLEISQIQSIIIVGGDGLLFEVVNGLLANDQAEKAMRTPIAVYPGGSGNAIAACIAARKGFKIEKSFANLVGAAVQSITSPCTERLNLMYVESGSFSSAGLIGVNWGFLSDCDIESEKYRRLLGGTRFAAQAVVRLASFRKYRGRLSFLRAQPTSASSQCSKAATPSQNQGSSAVTKRPDIVQDRLRSKLRTFLPSLSEPVPQTWETIEGKFVWICTSLVSHMARDLLCVPVAKASEATDAFYLLVVRSGISKRAMAQLLLKLEDPNCSSFYDPNVEAIPVTAFRIEPLGARKGIFTVDGELVKSEGPLQGCLTSWQLNFKAPPHADSAITRL